METSEISPWDIESIQQQRFSIKVDRLKTEIHGQQSFNLIRNEHSHKKQHSLGDGLLIAIHKPCPTKHKHETLVFQTIHPNPHNFHQGVKQFSLKHSPNILSIMANYKKTLKQHRDKRSKSFSLNQVRLKIKIKPLTKNNLPAKQDLATPRNYLFSFFRSKKVNKSFEKNANFPRIY